MKISECMEELLDILAEGKSISDKKTGKILTIKNPVSPNTIKTYNSMFNVFLNDVGDKDITKITIEDCQIFYNDTKFKVKATPITIINRFLKVQKKLGRINNNPMEEFKSRFETGGRVEKQDTYYISQEDLRKISYVTLKYKLHVSPILQGCMGLRSSEIHGNEHEFDRKKMSKIQIKKLLHGLTLNDGKKIILDKKVFVKGKGGKTRLVYFFGNFIGEQLTNKFLKYMKDNIIEGLEYIKNNKEKSKIDDRLVPITTVEYNIWLKEIQRKYKINVLAKSNGRATNKTLTTHKLRHTFGILYIKHGGKLEILKELMGHSNIATTQIYAKATADTVANEYKEMIKK